MPFKRLDDVCEARKPKCDRCNLEQLCTSKDKTWRS
ncbi:MAG: hypothetical protein ACLQGT_01520 [Terracidiphilus sp.]